MAEIFTITLRTDHISGYRFRYVERELPSHLSVRNGYGGCWRFNCSSEEGGWFWITGSEWRRFVRSHRKDDIVTLSKEAGDNFYTITVN